MKKVACPLFLPLLVLLLGNCNNPTPSTEKAWQKNMSEALLPEYSNFDGLWADSDIAAYIFSYKVPELTNSTEAFKVLKSQIINFTVYDESDNVLALRRSLSKSNFDEWRFLYNEEGKKITVLYANIDSGVEFKNYPFLIDKLSKYHEGELP